MTIISHFLLCLSYLGILWVAFCCQKKYPFFIFFTLQKKLEQKEHEQDVIIIC